MRNQFTHLKLENDSSGLRAMIDGCQPKRGFCLMIDIAGSTQLKAEAIDTKDWMFAFARTFEIVQICINHPAALTKIVGDMIMFWLPPYLDDAFDVINLFESLIHLQTRRIKSLLPLKIAVARCEKAFEITFVKEIGDVYGAEIDLTARLLGIAQAGEIVMSESFFLPLRQAVLESPDNARGYHDWLPSVEGPWSFSFKGITRPEKAYKYCTTAMASG